VLSELKNIHPTKNNRPINNLKNSNGLDSIFADWRGNKIKVYQNFNKEQVALRLHIQTISEVKQYFPEVLFSDGLYIAEEYIDESEQDPVNRQFLKDEIDECVKTLRGLPIRIQTWDYLQHIHMRIGLQYTPETNIKNYVNHNDLTIDNVIITKGGIKLIDNEFLSCNNAWFLNSRNSNILEDHEHLYGVSQQTVDYYWKIRKKYKEYKK